MDVKPMNNTGARWTCVAVVWLASMPHLPVGADSDPPCGGGDDELIVGPDQEYGLTRDETYPRVTIRPGGLLSTTWYTLTVTELLTIDPGGCLEVGLGKLDIRSDGPHTISGDVILMSPGSTLRVSCCAHARLSGVGAILGRDSRARITIDCGSSLTNDMMIQGTLRIDATDGSFINGYGGSDLGRVLANVGGPIDLAGANISDAPNSGSVLDDPPAYRWGVYGDTAILRFNQDLICDSNELHGNFYVRAGTLRTGTDAGDGDDIDVETTGDLTHTGGKIVAGVDDSFTFNAPRCPE